MNLRSFKLNRVYLNPLNMSKAGDFPGFEFLRILFRFKKRKENSSSYGHVLCKTANWEFHVVVVQWTSTKECIKKRDASAELLFWSLNLPCTMKILRVLIFAISNRKNLFPQTTKNANPQNKTPAKFSCYTVLFFWSWRCVRRRSCISSLLSDRIRITSKTSLAALMGELQDARKEIRKSV